MNKYRSHYCNALRKKDVGNEVFLSGWINKKRDHGNLLFVDLRDNYGITQCIIDKDNPNFAAIEKIQLETVVRIDGVSSEKISQLRDKAYTGYYLRLSWIIKHSKSVLKNIFLSYRFDSK